MTVYWWCSFCDGSRPAGSQFLGLLILPMPAGADIPAVAASAWAKGLNPGGEMLAYEWSELAVPAKFVDRLLTKEEAAYVDEWMARTYAERAVQTPDELRAMGRVVGSES